MGLAKVSGSLWPVAIGCLAQACVWRRDGMMTSLCPYTSTNYSQSPRILHGTLGSCYQDDWDVKSGHVAVQERSIRYSSTWLQSDEILAAASVSKRNAPRCCGASGCGRRSASVNAPEKFNDNPSHNLDGQLSKS